MQERGEFVQSVEGIWRAPVSTGKNSSGATWGTIRFLGYDSGGRAINQVDIWLREDELPVFVRALVAYPLPLPTDYLQTAELCEDGFSVRIRSHESPKTFVSRLSSALGCLGQSA
ncbi:hypothetical protein [Planococcus maritimus]|uniref:hypothetical protein n=1 Tax=Planococcus maritimus TaxID=192421 RepID=UPI00232D1517|nr:hypothetical protein [Planococcus maritimus]